MRTDRRRCRGDAGTSATTVALVFPVVLLMMTIIMQFGLNYHIKQRAAAAADRAVSVSRWEGATEQDGEAAGLAFLEGARIVAPDIDVDKNDEEVRATVRGSAEPLVPFASWTITATAAAPVERFIPEDEREGGGP